MAEREMRTAVESVRTMLLHMGVQHHWWHLALRQAVWVRNCLERSTMPPGTTPCQLLAEKKPDLTLARVWGCMVFDLTNNKVVMSVKVIFYETLLLEVDDDLLYDDAKGDKELPELDPDVQAGPEHYWDIATMTVKEAMARWKGKAVKAAMEEEIRSLIGMGTWELVEPHAGVLYMYQPDYFDDGTGRVCKLLKSLYRLKQSPLLWYRALDSVLLGAGWKKSQVYEALYFKASDVDLLGAGLRRRPAPRQQQPRNAEEAKGAAGGCLRAARGFAGRQVPWAGDRAQQTSEEAVASPAGLRRQTAQVLHRRGAGRSSPEDAGLGQCLRRAHIRRRGGAGAQGGGVLAEGWLATVRGDDVKAGHHVCLQQAGERPHESLKLIGYVDANDAGDKQNQTSTDGYVFVFGGAAVSWSSQCIKCVTLSSTE
ncbi:unnamed protein product [Closterium sp. NIES-53]